MIFTEVLQASRGSWITRKGYAIRQVWNATEVPPNLIKEVESLPFWIRKENGEIKVHYITDEERGADDWNII